ncbi:sialate O-acetylesterase [Dyadobacter tibetensis]|uniref:sialate O-acetylesterase n=1 Tax=Dyadobacter tibetensis TaxID=1211851 RepID=UPI00047190C1|nr:sialate O-acetylesterase [Dyadobacter tibetensis]
MNLFFRYFFLIPLLILPFEGNSQSVSTNGLVRLAPVFGSHMVLQQDKPINIWGEAEAGTPIHVQLGQEKILVKTDRRGKWKVEFPSRKASFSPLSLTVNDLRLEDILIGEVWLCSGQSNMHFPLKNMQTYKTVVDQLPNPNLRLYTQTAIRLVAKEGYTEKELERCNPQEFFHAAWEPSSVATASRSSAVAWLFADRLFQKLNVPIGIIQVALGGSAMNNWMPPVALMANPATASLFQKDWLGNESVKLAHRERARDAFQHVLKPGEPYFPGKMKYRWMAEPGFLFEAGIAPLKPMPFRGVLWYQGESDTDSPALVSSASTLFPSMIEEWRKYFEIGDFPFIFIQLPRFNNENWPAFRELQRRTQAELNNTQMVVTIDLGEEKEIHPKDKQPIGERATRLALKEVYGFKELLGFPELQKWTDNGQGLVLSFTECGTGFLPVEGEIPGFEVAGRDSIFHRANAKFLDSHTILLNSSVMNPEHIRYGWSAFPQPALRLFNSDNLPLGPFWVK